MLNQIVSLYRRLKLERELNRLDDRLLTDIGITRGEIANVVRASLAHGRPATIRSLNLSYRAAA